VTPSDPHPPDNPPGTTSEWKQKAEDFFSGRMPEAEREVFEREMAEHPAVAREVYAAMGMGPVFHEAVQALRVRQIESHARISDGSITRQVPWWGRTRSRLVLTVVVAVLVFLVVFVSRIGEVPQQELPIRPTETEGFRGLSPAGEIPPGPARFSWTAYPGASQYRFEIWDESSQPVYSTLTAQTSLVVDIGALSGRGFLGGTWRVMSLDPHGATLGECRPVEIRVAPRP
jgi:hypothetical protein